MLSGTLMLTASIMSFHLDRSQDWCEKNPGLGVHYSLTEKHHVAMGQYENSYCNDSTYFAAGYVYRETRYNSKINVRSSIDVIYATGYDDFTMTPAITNNIEIGKVSILISTNFFISALQVGVRF